MQLSFRLRNYNDRNRGGCCGGNSSPSVTFKVFVNGTPRWSAKSPNDDNTESGDVPNWNGSGDYQMGRTETATINISGVNRINSIEITSNTFGRESDKGFVQINSVIVCDRR